MVDPFRDFDADRHRAKSTTSKSNAAEALLGAAIHQEEAEGNLEGAIASYKKFLSLYGNNRPLAAKALYHLGLAYEKLGSAEAEKAYERVVKEFGDQKEAVDAQRRLTALGSARAVPSLSARRLWVMPSNSVLGGPSDDGRYLSYGEYYTTGNLAIRDLIRGTSQQVTKKGSWAESRQYAGNSLFSPDGKRVAFGWNNEREYELRVIDTNGANQKKGQIYTATIDWESSRISTPKAVAQKWVADFGPDWSKDGKYLAYVAHRGNNLQDRFVAIRSIETGGDRQVAPVEGFYILVQGGYRFSSDGKSFMAAGGDSIHGQGAYSIDLESGRTLPLITRPGGQVQQPAWLPGETSMIYVFRDSVQRESRF